MSGSSGYKKLLVGIAICVALSGIVSGYFGKSHAAYAAVVLTPILLCFAFLEHIAEFKAGKSGFVAKTRRLVSDAESAVEGVHALALLDAKIMLDLLSNRMGYHDHYLPKEVERLRVEAVAVLREMGIPMEDIKSQALSGWYRNIIAFYRGELLSHWSVARDEVQREMKELHKLPDEELPAALRQAYARLGITDRDECVDDLEHLIRTREHRRPEKWLEIRQLPLLK